MNILGRVLIIDDEERLRNTLGRILQNSGCENATAQDGNQALAILDEQLFDLVYLDIQLPGMDGLQVLKRIRKKYPNLPVILLTGHGTMQSAVEALRLGATDYLQKPIDPEVLVARTRTILKSQAIERRRLEIVEQISQLQAELKNLDDERTFSLFTPSPVPKPQERFLKRGPLILDLQAQSATDGDRVLNLPPAAFEYLVVLARHTPEIVDYQTLVFEAQNYQVESSEASELAKWHIHVLRQSLESGPDLQTRIMNIRGIGYRLVVE